MKTSIVVLGIGCAATMAIVLSTQNDISVVTLFETSSTSVSDIETEADYSNPAVELLTPLPDKALGLSGVLSQLHLTTVQAFEAVPFPYFGRLRTPTMTLLDESSPPKHVAEVAFIEAMSQSGEATKTQSSANEAWLWLQLMYGVTDRGFVYRSLDLRPDTVRRSRQPVGSYQSRPDWRKAADAQLSDSEQKAGGNMVVGFPSPADFDLSGLKPRVNRLPPDFRITLSSSNPVTNKDRIWRIRQVELVSLLQHDPPVVYLDPGPSNDVSFDPKGSVKLGRSGQKVIPTRSLNEMEVAALEALTEGKDRVFAWNASEERLQMVGAIRAKDACLKCHEVNRGDLLGAFTYWIEEDRKTPNEATASQDEAQ